MGLRVLMASDFYPPFIGGAERQVQLLSRELTKRGHDVHVVTVWHRGLAEREDDSGVTVHRIRALSTRVPWFFKDPNRRRFHPPFADPGVSWSLRCLVGRLQPQVVHAHGWIAYSCAAALRSTDIPLLVSVHDYGYTCALRTLMHDSRVCDGPGLAKCTLCSRGAYGLAKAAIATSSIWAGRAMLRSEARGFHSVSNFVQSIVRRDLLEGEEGIPWLSSATVIPNMVAQDSGGIEDDKAAESYLELLPGEPYILFVGALAAHKGLGHLLTAYRQLKSPPRLVLIGTIWPGSPREFPPGVTVLYNVPHTAVMVAWERCLFGVAPSAWPEPFGMVITEAMSKGKAVIAASIGGPPDIVADGKTGLLVPPGDAGALRRAMELLISDTELRERLGGAARQRAELFTPGVVVPQFESLYERLMGFC